MTTAQHTPATILVVDDDPGVARLIARELHRDGHHTATIASGEAAITWLNDNVADLVLLDLKLPGLRGNELIDRLDGFHDHLPFIIITGQGDERVAVEMMKRGALDYLVKDVNFITMVPTVVQRALARIKEQKRLAAAEAELRLSQEQYHTLFSTLIEGFCIIEVIFDASDRAVDYRFLEVNPAFEAQTGLCNAQGRLITELAPDNEAHWFEIYGRIARTGEPARFVNEARALKRWYDVSAFRFGEPDSRKVAILFNDITEAKRAEDALARSHSELERRVIERTAELIQSNESLRESRMAALNLMEDAIVAREKTEQAQAALRESEARFRGFFENVGVGTVELGVDGRFTQVNDRFCTITGYSREELLAGMSPVNLAHPEDAAISRERVAKILQGEAPSYESERRCVRKDGSVIWVSGTANTIYHENGTVRGIVGIAEDITDRVRAENEILKARRFAESTLEAIPASIVVLDDQGKILSTNQAWTAFAAANGGAINTGGVGTNYLAVCDSATGGGAEDAARFAMGIREVMSGEVPRFSMEYACHSPSQQRWFVGYVTPFAGNGPHSVVIAHVDVSERKRAEQVIRRLNHELEKRVELRTQQLQHINVELQDQVAARKQLEKEILHISEHEKQSIGRDLHDDLGQQLAGIWLLSDVLKSNLTKQGSSEVDNAEQITGLLKNSLALTRSLARGLHPVSVQQGGLVAALDELTTRTCDMFKVNCRCKCPPGIEMDNTTATHLYRIAQEAVTNAVKHGQAKEIDIELSTNLRSTVLSVKDQGVGIADLDPDRKGMGLRIMSYRADMIGGTLHIQRNQDGVGTTVLCSIPTPPSAKPAHV